MMTRFYKNTKFSFERGQTIIIATILFLAFSLVAVFGIVNPIIRHARATANIMQSKQGYFLAEAGLEDVIYRLKTGKQTSSSNTLVLNGEEVVTTLTDNGSQKIVIAEGDSRDFIRKIKAEIVSGIGVAFNYGIQTGTGGFSMSNNAGVNGNVYANGPIIGAPGVFVANSAFSANSASLAVEEENASPSIPPNFVTFGKTNSAEDAAQSFQVGEAGPIGAVGLYIRKVSTPSNITILIVADNAGNPSGTALSSATLAASLITADFGWIEIPMQTSADLEANAPYWIVLNASSNASKYYEWAANNTYAFGGGKVGQYGGVWNNTSPSGLDGYFKIYLGGLTGKIENVIVGSGGEGSAHAHEVNNSTIQDNLYCQNGSGNNKACNTSQPDPSPLPFPISDANITQWKTEASAGSIINGDYILDGNSATTGPAKINGNLTVINNSTLTIKGTIWVTGNIIFDNNINVKLDPNYQSNSGVLVADGKVQISNNTAFSGSGQTGSYIMVLTTSDCPNSASCSGNPAIDVGNNAGAVILNAQKGTIRFSNNAGAKEATANMITLSNNAVISYESGLSSVNFTSGPSGGYDILRWSEIE